MKIKLSFITNSSSTIFIIFVPENFVLEKQYISKVHESILSDYEAELQLYDYFEDFNMDNFIIEIQNQFKLFKEGKRYTHYGCSYVEGIEWRTLVKICEDNNLILTKIEMGSSGSDILKGISQESIINFLINSMSLDEFIKPFIGENKDDTEVTKEI